VIPYDAEKDILGDITDKLNINHGAQCAVEDDNLYHCICNGKF